MRRRFTIYSAFLDIKNSISWYQEINSWYQEIFLISRSFWYQEFDFLISRNRILDIKNSIFWYQEFDFLISRNDKYFLISRIRFPDIKNSNWYQENEFLISKNAYLNIKNSTSWYQEIIHISWYQKIEFLISRNRFLDIKKCILRYGNVFGPLLVDLLRYFESKLCRYIDIFCKKSKNLCWIVEILLDLSTLFLRIKIEYRE